MSSPLFVSVKFLFPPSLSVLLVLNLLDLYLLLDLKLMGRRICLFLPLSLLEWNSGAISLWEESS